MFRFAKAGPLWATFAKTLVQIVVVWTIALVVVPLVLASVLEWPRWRWPGRVAVGAVVLAAGSAVGLWSAWLMAAVGRGTPVPMAAARRLVTTGPYAAVRNPMAASAVVQLLGVAAVMGSGEVVCLAVAAGLFWQFVLRPPEERFLAAHFGADYAVYRARTPLWLPRPWRRRAGGASPRSGCS